MPFSTSPFSLSPATSLPFSLKPFLYVSGFVDRVSISPNLSESGRRVGMAAKRAANRLVIFPNKAFRALPRITRMFLFGTGPQFEDNESVEFAFSVV